MPLLNIIVKSSETHSERKLDPSLTIDQLKDKLVSVTGIQPHYQSLRLYPSADSTKPLAELNDGSNTLQSYGLQDYFCISVDNLDPNARAGEYSDVSGVEKFELTPEEYEQRSDTVLAHLKSNKLGRFAPVPTAISHTPPPPSTAPLSIQVNARCQVASEGGLERRGTVRFVGEASIGRGGAWVGVELDEPVGKGDGEVEGTRYFSCTAKHAVFVRPEKVTIGDFPEEDLMDDDDDEI